MGRRVERGFASLYIGISKAGLRPEDLQMVNLPVIMWLAQYEYFFDDRKNCLGNNAARSASATISVDGSGGSGFGLESVGGCGEESSEEIH